MEDFGSFWTIQENVEELKEKLQYVTYELEITRKETNEEIRKNSEHIKKLLQLFDTTCKERDEAKFQLRRLQQILCFNKSLINVDQIIPSTTFPAAPFSPDSPLFTNFPVPARASNSGFTESNSFSLKTNNINNDNNNSNNSNSLSQTRNQSHVSSPAVDSLSYSTPVAATASVSSESSNLCGNAYATTTAAAMRSAAPVKAVDQATLIIESLAKGLARPQQGKLLEAVIEAGPLLQTLMLSGSLPHWRNPPRLMTQHIPPVSLKGSLTDGVGIMANNKEVLKGLSNNSALYGQINGGSMGYCQSSVLDFGGRMMIPSALSFDSQVPKRQRLL